MTKLLKVNCGVFFEGYVPTVYIHNDWYDDRYIDGWDWHIDDWDEI